MVSYIAQNATAIIDAIDDARWVEVNGSVSEITRRAILHGVVLPPNSQDLLLDQALASGLLPVPGASHPLRPDLILKERSVTALGIGMASILLVYRRPVFTQQPPAGQNFTLSGGGSAEQITTMLDRQGNPITVTHNDVTQGGEISPLSEIESLAVGVEFFTTNPWNQVRAFNNTVNSGSWIFDGSATARTWLCGPIEYTLIDSTSVPAKYAFTYHFKHNNDGWDPQVVFIDPETGRPPEGLVADEGYKTIEWHAETNFNALPFFYY